MSLRFYIAIILSVMTAFLLGACQTASAGSQSEASSSKIIAIGDIHGDFDAYAAIITDAGLVDDKMNWAGGDTILIQTGDIADRGPDTRKIIEHIQKIQKQAPRHGGQVITLVGNHEAMNMTGDLRYVTEGEYAAFVTSKSKRIRDKTYKANRAVIEDYYRAQNLAPSEVLTDAAIRDMWMETTPLGKLEHQAAWAPDGEIGKWVAENPVIVVIDGYLFAHGGVGPDYAAMPLAQVNQAARDALKIQDRAQDSVINSEDGPLWYRGYIILPKVGENAGNPAQVAAQNLTRVLGHFSARRMIVGHTPSVKGIRARYDGRLIQIDTGASQYYGGTRSYLRIENGQIYAHDNGIITEIN